MVTARLASHDETGQHSLQEHSSLGRGNRATELIQEYEIYLFDMWTVRGQGYNLPSSSDKATGSMSFSPICLSLPYLLQSFCQICPELQSVQSTQKSRWRLQAANNPNRRGQDEEMETRCCRVAATTQHGGWQNGPRAVGQKVHVLPLEQELLPGNYLRNYLVDYLLGIAFASHCCNRTLAETGNENANWGQCFM